MRRFDSWPRARVVPVSDGYRLHFILYWIDYSTPVSGDSKFVLKNYDWCVDGVWTLN